MESLASLFSGNHSLLSSSSRKLSVFVPAVSSSCIALASPASKPRRKFRTSATNSAATTPHPTPISLSPTTIPMTIPMTALNPDVPTKKVLVPIGFGTEEIEAVVLIDVLRRAGAEVTVASVEPQLQVEASSGVKLVADTCITNCCDETFDLVALPGGMPGSVRLRDCEILRKITSKQAEEKRLYGAICAAPAVTLLPWGLLKRKQTTCHPAFHSNLPTFWAVKTNLQVSGELTTSRGPGTSFEFALCLVDQLFGESVAREVGEILLMNSGDISRSEEFNKVDWSLDHPPRILIPIANGCEEIEVITIVDILRRAKVDVVLASVERKLQVMASQGTRIVADKLISAAAETVYDLIILPGGSAGTERLSKSRVLKKLLKEQQAAGRLYGAICSSLVLLQKQGLLKGKRVTAHPSSVKNDLPTEGVERAKVVIDGKVITSVGLSCATDFVLDIVSKLFGNGRARSVAEGLVFNYPKSSQA